MNISKIKILDLNIKIYSLNTVVVGSGAAGLNAADELYKKGQKDIAIVTEGINKGTSRNTGSDKQTYYKLSLSGEEEDSIVKLAETLYKGGCMDGDIALVEAALSPRCFYKLVEIGVPFPHNKFGEYIGYKTDFDPNRRATSAGPYTSKYITEKLKNQILNKNISIFDCYQVISILTDKKRNRVIGLLTLNLNNLDNKNKSYVLFNCNNIVYATGGPAGIYQKSVYPKSQIGATGIALEAGAIGKNLTESQYGIGSLKIRWNLSGSYQQALPRYVSTDQNGKDKKEFLNAYFPNPNKLIKSCFLKGYEWPFDSNKVFNYKSSLIDLLIYNETINKNRRVWLDYTENPDYLIKNGKINFNLLDEESYHYLKNSNALKDKPIDRLKQINLPSYNLFKDNGIDLEDKLLEIDVCAQHNNGGLAGNIWWESNLEHFFPVGEVNGTHGVNRPGGSALNSGQVGANRAATFICKNYRDPPLNIEEFIQKSELQIKDKINMGNQFIKNITGEGNLIKKRKEYGRMMSRYGAYIRSHKTANIGIKKTKKALNELTKNSRLSNVNELGLAFQNYDILFTQYVYFSAIKNYIENNGKSRGSYMINDPSGRLAHPDLPDEFKFKLDNNALEDVIQKTVYKNGEVKFKWEKRNQIPKLNRWFESVWKDYRNNNIVK